MEKEHVQRILQEVEGYVNHENSKKYWLIRTDDGRNYKEFSKNNYIALNLRGFPDDFLAPLQGVFPDELSKIQSLKHMLMQSIDNHTIDIDKFLKGEKNGIGRITNQIYSMCYGIKKGDIVMIPDKGAEYLKIGRVTDDSFTFDESINYRFSFSRHVQWIKEIRKDRLDPYLYKALGAHQAICDISKYAEFIERNYNSYFVVGKRFQYVLTVNAENISAWNLTSMINGILKHTKEFSDAYELNIPVEDIDITINVNSPGKFGFCTCAAGAIVLMAISAILFGGSLNYDEFNITTNGTFHALVECVNEWRQGTQNLEQNQALFEKYIQSLDIQSVEDWNNAIDELNELKK